MREIGGEKMGRVRIKTRKYKSEWSDIMGERGKKMERRRESRKYDEKTE